MRRGLAPLVAMSAAAVPTILISSDSNTNASQKQPTQSESLQKLVHALDIMIYRAYNTTQLLQSAPLSIPSDPMLATLATTHLDPSPEATFSISTPAAAATVPLQEHLHHARIPFSSSDQSHLAHVSAVDIALHNPKHAAFIRRCAEEEYGSVLPTDRFTDAEFIRYVIHCGYLTAPSESQRVRAMEEGASQAVRTAIWLQQHKFSSDEELQSFSHLIHWGSPDAAGRPTLHIAIGRAVHECRGPAAIHFANAVISQMEIVRRTVLSDEPGRPQRVNVIMDASGATALKASRLAWVFKAVSTTLNHHYPGRLNELVLKDLPVMLTWLVKGVQKLVHPHTRSKVKVVPHSGD